MRKFHYLTAALLAVPAALLAQAQTAKDTTPLSSAAAPAATGTRQPSMVINRNGSQPSAKGPAQYFTGAVRVDMLFQPQAPSRASGGLVTFEPGARSAWHTHPLGQVLVVTAGTGWVQQEGGAKQEIRPGDVIWTPPGVKHWHGATATNGMAHIAITEALDGKNVDWLEKVSDEEYTR